MKKTPLAELLKNLTHSQRITIVDYLGITDEFIPKPKDWWRKHRNVGAGFIAKLQAHGYCLPDNGLPTHARYILENLRVNQNKQDVLAAIKNGKIKIGAAHGLGFITYKQICEWVGEKAEKPKSKWKFNPYTGDALS